MSVFGGLMVSMLASGTQDSGFAPDQSRRIFSVEKILSMPSFGPDKAAFKFYSKMFNRNSRINKG
jgi:uncharacterized protein (DUF1786 family)